MIRVGVVGLGFGQFVHIPAFQKTGRVKIDAVCSHNFVKAKDVAGKIGARAIERWETLVSDSNLDAVVIAVQPHLQTEILRSALENGKHVFFEKPLLGDDLESLLELARQKKLAHIIDYEFPEIDMWQLAKEHLPRVGKILHGVMSWHVETVANRDVAAGKVAGHPWKLTTETGGGTFNNLGCHAVYNLEWFFGPLKRLGCNLHDENEALDQVVYLDAEFESGAYAACSVSANAFGGSGHRVEIYGTKGRLVLENTTTDYMKGFTLNVQMRDGQPEQIRSTKTDTGEDGRIAAVMPLASRFCDWIEKGIPATPGLEQALRVTALMDLSRKSNHRRSRLEVSNAR